jgi:hypothetical protein
MDRRVPDDYTDDFRGQWSVRIARQTANRGRLMFKPLSSILVLLATCSNALGIINLQNTPRHLVDQAKMVMVGTVVKDGEKWGLRVDDAVKGQPPAAVALELGNCNKDQVDGIRALLTGNVSRPAVLVTSKRVAMLHIGGVWMDVVDTGNDRWQITGNSPSMIGTFAGGTDMLARMLKHLAEHPDATVPSTVGVKWTDNCIAGNVPDASALAAIEWPQNGKPALFVASARGDRLLTAKDGENAFVDVTAAAGLTSKSVIFTFVDMDGDGLADLVSYDGSAINVYSDGKQFKAAGPRWTCKIDDCIGLSPCSLDGRPGVLVSTKAAPVLLVAQQDGWKQIQLPPFAGNIGQVSPCIVADLDNDGYADILQPGETGGALWRGAESGFQAPVKSPVCSGGGIARHAVADFNEDGFADVFLAGPEKNTLWENDCHGGFTDVTGFAGSLSYKCPPGASAVMAMDLNHDGRADLCIGYLSGEMLYHFNRGFRSMGEERELRLPGAEPRPGTGVPGLQSFAVADFNGDNSADLAVLQNDGTVRVYFNDRVDAPALMLRLPRGVVGPVTVSCWTDEKVPSMTGLAIIPGHAPGVYLPVRDKGTVHLKYRFPGRPPATMSVNVGEGVSEVVLEPQASGR